MTDVDKTAEPETTGQEEPAEALPFEGNAVRVVVTKPIDVGRIQEELTRRTRAEVQVALQTDDIDHIASENRPATLSVSPGNLSPRVVQEVVDAHVANFEQPSQNGAPQAPTPSLDAASVPEEYQPLVKKLADGKNLSAAESSDLLRYVFGLDKA